MKTYAELCQAQREAYFAWQAAPAGKGEGAFADYLAASEALRKAQEPTQPTAKGD